MRRRELLGLAAGAALLLPRHGFAQQVSAIGFLSSRSPDESAALAAAFRQGLADTGYVEGGNLRIEYRWAEGHYDRLPALAADLAARRVAVIAATGGPSSAQAAKQATSTIPIVFATGTDPVATGLVGSLARPGGTLTGLAIFNLQLIPKRLELVSELVPAARDCGLLVNPKNPNAEPTIGAARQAANARGLRLQVAQASSEAELDSAFTGLAEQHAGALLVGGDPFFTGRRAQIAALAARHNIPAIYEFREFAAAGGLISYAPSLAAIYRQVGVYAGRILRGAKPAELPVEQPTKFELVINLKTAKALGLAVPQSLLARADEVIE
jgi:putative ABC transport system substrate-binding protein